MVDLGRPRLPGYGPYISELPNPADSPGNLLRAKPDGTGYELLETPAVGNIAQFDGTAYRPSEGPGAIGYFDDSDFTDPAIDTEFIYRFPSLTDFGPLGLDLELDPGSGTIVTADMVAGSPAAYFNDDGANLRSIDPNPSALVRYDNLLLLQVVMFDFLPNNTTTMLFSGPTELPADNALWQTFFSNPGLPRPLGLAWEFGSGSNVLAQTATSGFLAPSISPVHVPLFIAQQRFVMGPLAFVQNYVGPVPFGPLLGPFTLPDGGTAGRLYVGGFPGIGSNTRWLCRTAMKLSSSSYVFTQDDVRREYNKVMGPFYGAVL